MLNMVFSDAISGLHSRASGSALFLILLFIAAGVGLTLIPQIGLALCGIAVAWWLNRIGILATLLGLTLIVAPMRDVFNTTPVRSVFTAALARNIESGTPERRIEFMLIFAIGALLLLKGSRRIWRISLLLWAALILAFSFSSLLWSKDTELTLRKDIVTLSVFAFSLGVGAVFYGKKKTGHISLVHAVCLGSVACSIAVLYLAVMHQQFRIFDPHWRLGALGHENQIAWIASVGVLPAWATRKRQDIWPQRLLWRICMWIPASVLVMTKSRTTIGATIVSMLLAEFWFRKRNLRTAAAAIVVISALATAASTKTVQQFWSRGESKESLDSLSGRTQLWHTIVADARDRPLLV